MAGAAQPHPASAGSGVPGSEIPVHDTKESASGREGVTDAR